MRPCHCHTDLLPGNRASLAIVGCQKLKIENVDVAVVIQVCGGWGGSVVVHANGHGIELVDDVIAINITSQQCHVRQ